MIIIIMSLFCCNKVSNNENKLSYEYFNYTDELKDSMKILKTKTSLCDLDKELVLIKSDKFSITNLYIIPFLYFELTRYAVPLSDYSKEDIENFMFYTANNRAINQAIYMEAQKVGISADSKEIDDKINEIADGDINMFKKRLEKSPIRFDFVLFDAEQVIIIEKFKNEYVIKDVTIDENEILEFYEKNPSLSLINPQVTVRHILLKTNGLNSKEKELKLNKMKEILERIKKGENFSNMAKIYSEDEATKNNGGKLGPYIEKGQIIKEFEDIAFNTKEKEISDIFETEYGYHILTVDKIKSKGKIKFNEKKEEIRNLLLIEKKNKKIDDTKKEIEKKYHIEQINNNDINKQ